MYNNTTNNKHVPNDKHIPCSRISALEAHAALSTSPLEDQLGILLRTGVQLLRTSVTCGKT